MLRFYTAGETHGELFAAFLEGIPAGLRLTTEHVELELGRRRNAYGRSERMAIETDDVRIAGGLFKGKTSGAPIAILVANRAGPDAAEHKPVSVPRPGHADLAGMLKFGTADARQISERASARETAARVAAGAVAKRFLAEFGIRIGSYVEEVGGVRLKPGKRLPEQLAAAADGSPVRCPVKSAARRMTLVIDAAKGRGTTVGGIFTVVATFVPPGLGSHVQWDRRLDGMLAQALMSIPAVKGVEIGDGFLASKIPGNHFHDEIFLHSGRIIRLTNRAGGIEGGMSNGMPIIARAAVKPVPTLGKPLRSVNLTTRKPATTAYVRSDVCAVPAASVVGEAVTALILASCLIEKLGGDSMEEMRQRAGKLRR